MASSDRNASGSGNDANSSRGNPTSPSQSARYPPGHVEQMRPFGRVSSNYDQISPYSQPAGPVSILRRSDRQSHLPFDPRIIPNLRITALQEARLFTMPPLPDTAMTPQQLKYSQILTHPHPSAFRRDGTIMRSWFGANIPGEFRKNNNCLKASAGTIAHIGADRLNLSQPYWTWLLSSDAPNTHASAGPLARRAVLCDEQHNRDSHSADGQFFVCPHPHRLADEQEWPDHAYEHLVCAACERAQPHSCAPLVRAVLTDGPLVAMCEACALSALARHGAGHNGCACTRGALGGLCLRHQNDEAAHLARRWLAYRERHHGPGGRDERGGGEQVVVPYCRCGRVPVPRSRLPFAFWCAACEGAVVLPRMGEGWAAVGEKKPQRWLLLDNLPAVDYDAGWTRSPSGAPPYRDGGRVVDPDRFR